MSSVTFAYVPSSHLDLFWLGNYNTTLERGAHVIKSFLDRCLATDDETFLLETTVFADYFLRKHPEYKKPLLRLIVEGRVEVGAVYVDRWEHLIPGESHIRNIQFGVEWCREVLGIDNLLATHPDLPGLIPQTSQIYFQTGIKYYVTSRKIFEHGAVWRHVSPDGSSLLYLNWPRHYMYFPLDAGDLPRESGGWGAAAIDVEATSAAFPNGIIPINGSAADLTDPDTFKDRYGAYLWDLVAANREKYPEHTFIYTIPGAVLETYDAVPGLPEVRGEIPSVWGVACDEEVTFFRRNRRLEDRLLTAETLVAIANHAGLDWRPESADTWQGATYESAFYARKDPIAPGQVLRELWRMQLFTADHNGGGYEGALSSFQKRVIQERALAYADEVIRTTLSGIGERLKVNGPGVLLFNPLGRPWSGPIAVALPATAWNSGLRLLDEAGKPLPSQLDRIDGDQALVQVQVESVPSVGYRLLRTGSAANASEAPATASVKQGTRELEIATTLFDVTIDRYTGAITRMQDRARSSEWGRIGFGRIRAFAEVGNDVTLRMNPDRDPVNEKLLGVDLTHESPLFTRVQLRKSILDAAVTQTLTIWADDNRIDLETRIRWWGAHNWQLRMALPSVPDAANISYGTPFYGSAWSDITPEAAPRNPDEILLEDYPHYREAQQWLHLRQETGGLLMITSHPGFHHDDFGLSAVLMRTPPSCGDPRLFWENAGEQIYRFSFIATGPDWHDARPFDVANGILRPPVQLTLDGTSGADWPASQGFLALEAGSAVLSSIAANESDGTLAIRVFEGCGQDERVSLSGPLVDNRSVTAVNLLNQPIADRDGITDDTGFDLPAWRIQTFRVG